MTRRIFLIIVLILTSVLIGCVGARPIVALNTAKVPVSMSGVILDNNGEPLYPNQQIAVGRFKAEQRGWAMGYSFLQLNPVDFSEELNKQVAAVDGVAVVNLEVASSGMPCVFLHVIQITQILPIFLGCNKVMIEGDIIRIKELRPLKNDQQSRTMDPSPKLAEPEKKVEEKKAPEKKKAKKAKKEKKVEKKVEEVATPQ